MNRNLLIKGQVHYQIQIFNCSYFHNLNHIRNHENNLFILKYKMFVVHQELWKEHWHDNDVSHFLKTFNF